MNQQTKPMSVVRLVDFHNHQSRLSANDTPTYQFFHLPLHLLIGAVATARVLEGVAKLMSSQTTY